MLENSKIENFRFWTHKVLPLVYDDSLSYYEFLCKVVAKLNEVIDSTNTTEENMEELIELQNQLQEFVNTYFENLDVQQEIDHKLDEMVEDGTFDRLITPIVEANVGENLSDVVANQIGGVVADQIDEVVSEQIDAVVASQIGDSASEVTAEWLEQNVDPIGSAVTVDKSLTVAGSASDAKVVGEFRNGFNATLYECNVTWTIVNGEYIKADGTGTGSSTKYCRTNLLTGYPTRTMIQLDNSVYEYRVTWYDSTGVVTTGTGFIGVSEYAGSDNIHYLPRGAEKYGLTIRRVNQTNLTTSDITAIKNALHIYSSTDDSLSESGKSADAKIVGEQLELIFDSNNFSLDSSDFKTGYLTGINSDYSTNTATSSSNGYITTKLAHYLSEGDTLYINSYSDDLDISVGYYVEYDTPSIKIVDYIKIANGLNMTIENDGYYYITLRKSLQQITPLAFTGVCKISHNTNAVKELLNREDKVIEIPCLSGENVTINSSGNLTFSSSTARARTDFFCIPKAYKYFMVEAEPDYVYNLFEVTSINNNAIIPATNIDSWSTSPQHHKTDENIYIVQVTKRNSSDNVGNNIHIKLHLYKDIPVKEFVPFYNERKVIQQDTLLKRVADYKQIQGSACDDNGVLFVPIPNETGSTCTIMLFDTKTNEIIETRTYTQTPNSPIFGHMNDVAFRNGYWYVPYYNADGVAHKEVFKFAQDLSSCTVETFTKDGEDFEFSCWRFCYDKTRDKFYASYSNDYTVIVFDENLVYERELTLSCSTTRTGSSKTYMQGCETDGTYLYFCNTSTDFKFNYISVFEIENGTFVDTLFVNLGYNDSTGTGDELESLCYDWISSNMYITYYVKVEGSNRGYAINRVNVYSQPDIAKLLHKFS